MIVLALTKASGKVDDRSTSLQGTMMSNYRPVSYSNLHPLRWTPFTDYRHAEGFQSVPVIAPEVSRIAAELPLAIKSRENGEGFELVCLLSFEPESNLCINTENKWRPGYVPIGLRTNPFSLQPLEGLKPGQKALCVDLDSPWVGEDAKQPFFQESEAEEPVLHPTIQKVYGFLSELVDEKEKTDRAVSSLVQALLLSKIDYVPSQGKTLEGFYTIHESALQELSDERWLALRQSGGLALAYSIIISQHQLLKLDYQTRGSQSRPSDASSLDLNAIFSGRDQDLFKL
jgi:hypothetical protein